MRHFALIIATICLAACTSDTPAEKNAAPAAPAAAPPAAQSAPVDESGKPDSREIAVKCLDLFREKRFQEALDVCQEAEKVHPGDAQLRLAIEGAKAQLEK